MGYYIYAPEPPYVSQPGSGLIRINHTSQAWQIEDKFAARFGTNPQRFEACPGETIWDKLQAAGFGRDKFHETVLGPGEFYPRIWRPSVPDQSAALGLSPAWNPSAQHETHIANITVNLRGQLTTLMRQMERICQTVQPEEKNLDAFGHDIRNLLILACTEAEAHWRNVLVANGGVLDAKGVKVKENHYKTRHYVLLPDPMRLNEYAVTFPSYPWLEAFKPFDKWNADDTTQSLEWYDAYNAVKHNREAQFARATLRHAFEAISACVIMMVSQFGKDEGLGAGSELQAFIRISGTPVWPLSDCYIPPFGKQPTQVPFDFKTTNSKR